MGRRNCYTLTDAQVDVVLTALLTHESELLDQEDDKARTARHLQVLNRARAVMLRPAHRATGRVISDRVLPATS